MTAVFLLNFVLPLGKREIALRHVAYRCLDHNEVMGDDSLAFIRGDRRGRRRASDLQKARRRCRCVLHCLSGLLPAARVSLYSVF